MNDFSTLLQALVALLFVLCLIGLCAVVARRYAPRLNQVLQSKSGRLKLLEVLPLDPQHRAVLIRCDEADHLLVVGSGGVTVVAQNVKPMAGDRPS